MLSEKEVLCLVENQEKVLVLLQNVGGDGKEFLKGYDVMDTFRVICDEILLVLPDENHIGGDPPFPEFWEISVHKHLCEGYGGMGLPSASAAGGHHHGTGSEDLLIVLQDDISLEFGHPPIVLDFRPVPGGRGLIAFSHR